MNTRLMKVLVNLKSQFKRTKKYQKEVPIENVLDEDDLKANLPTDSQKTQPEFNDKELQRVLEEWRKGKIICGKWNAFQDDDARLK